MATTTPPRLDFTPLRRLRERRGWSRKELSRLAGMHPATLDRIEHNLIDTSLVKVFALSRALGVPADRLYTVVE